jgi:arsenate reductase
MSKRLLCVAAALAACKTSPARPAAQVVFVCEHGAAKSVVAAAYFNTLAAAQRLDVKAVARGADQQQSPSVSAVKGLRADGLAPNLEAPRLITASDMRSSVEVIAFDCEEPAMKALGGMDACWNDVPAMSDGYDRARDGIRVHVAAMLEQMAKDTAR